MANLQYIGARYVPKFYLNPDDNSNDWKSGVLYEALTIVTYNNDSYTSKITVPASVGNPIDNPAYWACTTKYTAALMALQTIVGNIENFIGDAPLDTTAQILSDAINELKGNMNNYKVYNVLDYLNLMQNGDISTVINAIIGFDSTPVKIYIPNGEYECKTPILLNKSQCYICGESRGAKLKVAANMTALFDLSGNYPDIIIEHLTIDCDYKATYAIYSSDWVQECLLNDLKIGYVTTAISMPTYLSIFKRIWCFSCTTGFDIKKYSSTRSTSTTFIDCYATDCTDGFKFQVTYSNAIGCAADRCDVAYNVLDSQGFNILGCGSEYCKIAVKCTSWWGGSLIGYYGYLNGDDSYDNTHYIFDFNSAVDIVIAGYHGTIAGTPKLLNVSGTTYGYENVTVLDRSITKKQSSYTTSSFMFKRPIKFLRDSVGHDTVVEVGTLDELVAAFNNMPETIDYNLTIKLTADITCTSTTLTIAHLVGEGRLIIDLNGHTLTSRSDTWKIFMILNCTPGVTIINGTLNNGFNSNQQQLVEVENARVSLNGIAFVNTLTKCGSGVTAIKNAIAIVGSTCTKSGSFGSDGVWQFMHCDDLSLLEVKATF